MIFISCLILSVAVTGCNKRIEQKDSDAKTTKQNIRTKQKNIKQGENFTVKTKVKEVINDPTFKGYGRLIFPVDIKIEDDLTLQNIEEILPWYSEINPKRTVEIINYMKNKVQNGNQIFYDIYTDQEKKDDPDKRNTGLFFFKGKAGAKTACEDLARAIAFLYEDQKELQIDMKGYSLWGGSAGARMGAWLGSYGTSYFGEKAYPKPGAVIMQYTGLSEVTKHEPPTYECVGTRDGIASYHSVRSYICKIKKNGTDAEIQIFDGLTHGLGEGTVAEGWINEAVRFWERQVK